MPNIQKGKGHDLTTEPGATLWRELSARLQARAAAGLPAAAGEAVPRFGEPILVRPRLGQGSFRAAVLDAYGRRCAATQEKALPVLQAGHIRPYSEGGEHRIDNGLVLRSDFHTLFDRGYLTVTPEYRIEVSRRLKEEFENGEHYYGFHGKAIAIPTRPEHRPAARSLEWHNNSVFAA